jgi:hypothetical protein
MVPHAPPTVAPTLVLRSDWETLSRLAFRWSKLPDLDAYPAPSSLHRFYGASDKPKPAWFWGPTQETVAVILRPKSPNWSCRFWGPNWKTVATGFEAKPEKTVPMVLRLNHWQTVDHGFEAQPRNHWVPDLCDHLRSTTPGLLLLPWSSSLHVMPHLSPAHHETSKHDSPLKQKTKVKQPKCPGFEFKPRQVNDSSQSNQGTNYLVSQSPPWWVHWQQKYKV